MFKQNQWAHLLLMTCSNLKQIGDNDLVSNQICSADETGLYFRMLQDKT